MTKKNPFTRVTRVVSLVAAGLALALSSASATTLTFQTPISGDPVPVTVTLDEPAADTVELTVEIPAGQGDLLGLFGNVVDEALVSELLIGDVSGMITQWQFAPNAVAKVGGGNNTNPVAGWDWGVRIGSTGGADGAVTSATFRLVAPGLDIAQLLEAPNAGWILGVRVQDTTGSEGSAKVGVSGDAPRLTIVVPYDGAFLDASPTAVAGKVLGAGVAVDVNGVVATVTDSTFDASIPLAEGANEIVATGTNALGSASDRVNVVLDTVPPVVGIESPANGLLTLDEQVTVTGTVTDASPIDSLTVAGAVTPVVEGAFSATVPLLVGDNAIEAVAVDAAGNAGSAAVTVTRGEVPTIQIGTPAEGSLLAASIVSVTGTVTGIPEPAVSVNGVAAQVSGGAFSAEISLVEGSNTITATASNGVGSATDTVSVVVDTLPPVVSIEEPTDGAEFTEQPILVSGTVADASAIVALTLNGEPIPAESVFSTATPLVDGPNELVVQAFDAAGNVGAAVVTVTFQEKPPLVISIGSPVDGSLLSTTPVSVVGTISDSTAVVDVNGVLAAIAGDQFVASNVPLSEGTNTLTATALRDADTASASVTVELNLPPEIVVTFPTEGAVIANAATEVRGFVNDVAAVVDVNGVGASVAGDGSFIAMGVPLSEGANTLTARATDALGASSSAIVQVTREDDAPGLARVVVVDPNRCALESQGVCAPVALVSEGAAEFRDGLVTLNLAPASFLDPPSQIAVDGQGFHAYVFSQDSGEASLAVSGGGPALSGADATLTLQPISELAGDLSSAGLDTVAVSDLVPSDFAPGFFARFDLVAIPGEAPEPDTSSLLYPGPTFPVGREPRGLTVGDFDADGLDDIVAANAGDDDLSLLLGRDDRSFAPEQRLPAGSNPHAVVAVDLDGDGHNDLVTANRFSDAVSVQLGNGDGTFAVPSPSFFSVGDGPEDLEVRDVSGDGIPDVVAPVRQENAISVLLGNGDGSFQPRSTYPAGTLPSDLSLADVDGDGVLDAMVNLSFPDLGIAVLVGNGDGSFQAPQVITVGFHPTFQSGDLDGDGNADLLVLNFTNDLQWLRGNGDGTFGAPAPVAPVSGRLAPPLDVDADGDLDLQVASPGNFLHVLRNDGTGFFELQDSYLTIGSVMRVRSGDFDGDGHLDLAYGNFQRATRDPFSYVGVLFGRGDGTFLGASDVFPVGGAPSGASAADVNADGHIDVVVANEGSDDVSVLLGNGDGTFQSQLRSPVADRPRDVAVADFDSDGVLDLAVTNVGSPAGYSLLRGAGDGSFQDLGTLSPSATSSFVDTADLDGDGAADLIGLARFPTDGFLVFMGNGDGTFGAEQFVPLSGDAGFDSEVADVDGDGVPDLVAGLSDPDVRFGGLVEVRLGLGDGSFGPPRTSELEAIPARWDTGDYTGDGIPDFVAVYGDQIFTRDEVFLPTATFRLVPGNGDGTFSGEVSVGVGDRASPQAFGAADLDGDGNLDLALANTLTPDIWVALGNGDGTFQPLATFAGARDPRSLLIADVDERGGQDLLTVNRTGFADILSVFLSQASGAADGSAPTLLSATAGPASDDAELIVDVQSPGVEIDSPQEGARIAGNAVNVTGRVSDLIPEGVVSGASPLFGEVAYRVRDALDVTLETGRASLVEGTFSIRDVLLGSGVHCIEVVAIDAAGNSLSDEVCVDADPTAPTVTLVSPLDGQNLVDLVVPVDLLFAQTTTLTAVDGNPDGRVFEAGLAEGVVDLVLELGANVTTLDFDNAVGSFSLSFTVFLVDDLPALRIETPVEGQLLNTLTVDVAGTVPLGSPLVQVNGVTAVIAEDGVSFTARVPLAIEGANDLTAVDVGSARSASVRVTRDTTQPFFEQLFPVSGATTANATVSFAGVMSETASLVATGPGGSVSGATQTQVILAGDPDLGIPPLLHHPFDLAPLALAPGENAIEVVATDLAGNQASAPVSILHTDGALQLVSPASGSQIPALRTDVVVDASESVIVDSVLSGDRRVPALAGRAIDPGQATLPDVPLVSGDNEIRVVYRNAADVAEVLTFSVVSTATAPATVTGTVTDASTGDPIGGAVVSLTAGGLTLSLTTDAAGGYTTEVEPGAVSAVAAADGFATQSASGDVLAAETLVLDFALDPSGSPSVTNQVAILVPPDGTVTDFDELTVVGTVLNPESVVSVNGIAAQVVGNRFVARGVPLAFGANAIDVTATAAGVPSVSASVAVERADEPVLAVKIYSPPAGAAVPGGGLVVRAFVSAADARVLVTEIGQVAVAQGVVERTGITLPIGEQQLAVVAELPDGTQSAFDEVTLTVASEEPALRLEATPPSGPAPLDVILDLVFNVEAFDVERIDIDTDGDGTLDVLDAQSGVIDATLVDPRTHAPLALVTTPESVEMSARTLVAAHLPHVEVREFAHGNPVDLARGPDDRLYVLDGAAGTVSRYSIDGQLLQSFGASGSGPDHLSNPQALAIGADGRVYVADTGNDRVQVFNGDGSFDRSIGAEGSAPGEMSGPRGVLVRGAELLVSDTGNDRVQTFDLNDDSVSSMVAVSDPRGLTDGSRNGILAATPSSEKLVSLLLQGSEPLDAVARLPDEALLFSPVDVSQGGDGILIADAARNQVVVTDRGLVFRRLVERPTPPLAVLSAEQRAVESIFVADGTRVVEIAMPAPSPLPALESLAARIAADDAAGALQLIHPLRRPFYEELYTQLADLPAEAAAIEAFEVVQVREGRALALMHRTVTVDGQPMMISFPVQLVRKDDGGWWIFDY